VVFTRVAHEPVVFRGQGGVDAAGLAGGHEQCLPQDRVTTFGRPAVPPGQARRGPEVELVIEQVVSKPRCPGCAVVRLG
jgi:hypothetical protein